MLREWRCGMRRDRRARRGERPCRSHTGTAAPQARTIIVGTRDHTIVLFVLDNLEEAFATQHTLMRSHISVGPHCLLVGPV